MNKYYIYKQLVENIRIERIKRGFSQEYMSSRLGISQNVYSRIERCVTRLDIERLYEITVILDLELKILLIPSDGETLQTLFYSD